MKERIRAALLAAGLAASTAAGLALSGCAPLLVGGAMVGGTMVAIDRRTAGAQLEDEAIELKVGGRASEVAAGAHVSATSFNRLLLLTGEVGSDTDRRAVEQAATRVENVRSVVNELAVAENTSLGQRSSDSVITGKVKAAMVDAHDLQANTIKVVTERGIVYLMGVVTEREATRAAEVSRNVSGVQKVVRVFELVSEADLAAMQPKSTK